MWSQTRPATSPRTLRPLQSTREVPLPSPVLESSIRDGTHRWWQPSMAKSQRSGTIGSQIGSLRAAGIAGSTRHWAELVRPHVARSWWLLKPPLPAPQTDVQVCRTQGTVSFFCRGILALLPNSILSHDPASDYPIVLSV